MVIAGIAIVVVIVVIVGAADIVGVVAVRIEY